MADHALFGRVRGYIEALVLVKKYGLVGESRDGAAAIIAAAIARAEHNRTTGPHPAS
jgi:hypothetical protein